MLKLKVGIAGYGVVGKRRRACVDAHPNLNITAVCDRNFKENAYLEDGLRSYTNYLNLLREDLDILFVCLTNDIAAEVAIAGLERGLHVFCEKPPGRNVSEIRRVINHEKRHPKLKLMYGFNHRYHHSVQEALQVIRSGELGKILNLRGVYGKSKLITFNQADWRTKREIAGGGVLLDQGIHMLDLMRLFAGEFSEIHSFVSNSYWNHDVEDNVYALMKTNQGIVGMLHSSATQWRHRFHLDINLEKGSVILGGILSGSKSYGAETLTIVSANPDSDMGDPQEKRIRYNKDPSWDEEIKYFVRAILNDDPIISSSSQDALQTMELDYKIYCADENWCKQWSFVKEIC